MKKVYTAADPQDAHLVRGLLEGEGIDAVVQGEALWGARGVLPFGADSAPTVWIADESAYDRACTLIRNHQSEPTHCGHCGYDLTGLPEPRCPECGRPFLRRAKREDWTCPGCGETIEGQFTECWSCGHEAPATEGEP